MRPANLQTKILLDSGDPKETRELLSILGFLDGQTTNPSLIAKNPQAQERLANGKKFSKEEVMSFYKDVVSEISAMIPDGSVSIEVDANAQSDADELFAQGKDMYTWIPNAHIKYPTTAAGLEAAERAIQEGIRVNMTLVFSQEQAAAVYAATHKTQSQSLSGLKNVFVSPFIGRLDDRGENGMDLIRNLMQMYQDSDHHVAVLAASIRTYEHLMACFAYGTDMVTAPLKIYIEWAEKGMPVPDTQFEYKSDNLTPIMYTSLDLSKDWSTFDISHQLTDKGLQKFSEDWNNLAE
ncbi:MAG TPA: transaldolase family protein [Candidatus Acidoferrales bacterium]|nr:transaldolase family protein [Candidatus Acidoferrales bacterium]